MKRILLNISFYVIFTYYDNHGRSALMGLRREVVEELIIPNALLRHGVNREILEQYGLQPTPEDDATRVSMLLNGILAVRVRRQVETGWSVEAIGLGKEADQDRLIGRVWMHGIQEDRADILDESADWVRESAGGMWVPEQIVEIPGEYPDRKDIEVYGILVARKNQSK